ncbi:unnamed protein product [Didymodactylos carnosus]|uniref:Reverse transcriptase RNase H-like domain-containing protein n=1 Tax=Didymodactylos carnosus TaxID=1234261 RepID=A0A815ITY9_9BILA|nr:unnamed protein product [Didymodactylos carnosus]CAF4255897.1 unnamed protein product [Didymodactylos carnosus]
MPNPDNIRGLLDTKSPRTAKEAFRFVKAAEYYRKFIPHFSQIAEPLYKYAPTTAQQRDKRSQSSKIVLSSEEGAAFNELKRILTTDLVFRLPNNVLPFKLQTDASDEGIGAVLIQTSSLGDHPVAYLSKKFSPTQKKWSTSEQECYAIISSIKKWNQYLDGQEFIVETDHKPLEQLNEKAQVNKKCERWRLQLQQYRFKLKYIKGKDNTIADYLSRSPTDEFEEDPDEYTSTSSQSTQTDDIHSIQTQIHQIVGSVTTRAQAKQSFQDDNKRNAVSDRSCDTIDGKRNDKTSLDQSWDRTNEAHVLYLFRFAILFFSDQKHVDKNQNEKKGIGK